jgi:hypothetical protein
MKRKIFSFITIFSLSFSLLIGCSTGSSNNNSGGNQIQQENRAYITHFDNYHECVLFPTFFHGNYNWGFNAYNEGSAETDWNITKKEYISEGSGSLYFRTLEGNFYVANIDANNYLSQYYDINGAKKISLDIYNPSNVPIRATMDVKSAEETMFSFSAVCMPNSWTVLSQDIEQRNYEYVDTYTLTLKNEMDSNTFELYLDNFYLEF